MFAESLSDEGPPQSPNDCGTWVRNINGGVFTSPNYPGTYPANKECTYILEGKEGGVMGDLSLLCLLVFYVFCW